MKNLAFILIIISVALTGCGVPSVHPLYENNDLTLHEELAGAWSSNNGDTYYVFSAHDALNNPSRIPRQIYTFGNDSTEEAASLEDIRKDARDLRDKDQENLYYIAKAGEEDFKELYYGGLVKLNSEYYLDLYKIRIFEEDAFRFPTHVFVKIEIKEEQIILYEFKTSFIKNLIKEQQIRIKHEYSGENLLLTASSKELQKFILKYGKEDAAYGDTHTYYKQPLE
ncbi:MAG: hypothetical protein U5J95_01415 [Balneolaceae bacterium]|nr:hypothetical protein [Balneolaceae bacterium]